MPSPTLLRASFDALHFTGLTKALAPMCRGRGIILCLHQVLPDGGRETAFSPNHQLEVSTAFLDQCLAHLRRKGYRLISLDQAVLELKNGGPAEPFAVITLDDGYRDNAVHAAPIFRNHHAPYTIYVTTSFADGTGEIWWKALELLLTSHEHLALEEESAALELSTPALKHAGWRRISAVLQGLPEPSQRQRLRSICARYGVSIESQCRELIMNWDELRDLARDPLCTIGAHTLSHYAVKRLPQDAASSEIGQSGRRIAAELGRPVTTFAYPYGDTPDAGPRDFLLAKQAGYSVAVTTRKGVVQSDHAFHLHALPRVMLSGRYQTLRYFDALLSGVPLALLNGFRKVDVS